MEETRKGYEVPTRIARMVRRAEEALANDKSKARDYVKLVRGIPKRKRAKRSNLFVRKAHAFVENATARDVAAIFQFKPYFDVESRTSDRTREADNAEIVLQYFLEKAELEMKSIGWFKQSVTENVGIMKLGWKKVARTQQQRMPLDEAMKLPKFKLPDELKGKHVFVGSDGMVATDKTGAMVIHEGSDTSEYTEQGYEALTLDKAPLEVQKQFSVVVKAPKVLYDGLELTPIEFQDCFWDPDASSVDELRYVGHHSGKTMEDLKREKESGVAYKNLDRIEEYIQSSGTPDLARYRRRSDLEKSDSSRYYEDESLFRVTELWDIQAGKLYAYLSADHDPGYGEESGILIREEDHPYWHNECPYHFLPATVIPFEMLGVGIPELIQHLHDERNDLRNIAMDNKVFSVMPPMFFNENVIDKDTLNNWEPARKIPVDIPEGTPIETAVKIITPDVTALQNLEFLIRAIDTDMEEVTGVTKVAQGIAISRRTTYSEQSLLSNESNVRFRMRIMMIDLVMKRLARQALKLLDQFVDPQIEVPVTGDDGNRAFVVADREDLSFEYDIHPASSSAENLASMQMQAQNMIQGYGNIKGTQMEAILRAAPFLREYFRKLGVKNSNQFIMSDDEIQQMQQQQQMMAQQQQPGQPQEQPEPQEPDETELISEENRVIMLGEIPPVSPRNNHELHMQGHEEIRVVLERELIQKGVSPEQAEQDPRAEALVAHLGEHMRYLEGDNGNPQVA